MKPRPLVDAKIYSGERCRGRHARLLVFVTQREMYEYVRSTGCTADRHTRAMCLDFTMEPGPRVVELVFSAGFNGHANEYISHECLHAVLRLCSDSQLAKALSHIDDEERFLAYPLGRMVRRVMSAIHDTGDSLPFYRPVGRRLKAMRAIANG